MSEVLYGRVEGTLKAALQAEADSEGRSLAKQLERILRERYGSALAERVGAATPGRTDSEVGAPAQDHGETEVPVATRSASADEITAAGANGDQPDPPTTRVAVVKEAALAPPAGAASAKPKKKVVCPDVTHGRSGWRCKTCGEFTA